MGSETEEERRARKERERAERKAKEAAAGGSPSTDKAKETEEERRARKDRERAERKAREAASESPSEKPKETEEERRVRKDRERAERKAKEAAAAAATTTTGSAPAEKPKETEEERRARKEREHAERKAKEAAAAGGGGGGPSTDKPKETEEERRARKEREHAERKARDVSAHEASPDKAKETEEERRARKDRERAERKAREAAAAEGGDGPADKPKETEEERRARKDRERAERRAQREGKSQSEGAAPAATAEDQDREQRRKEREQRRQERQQRADAPAREVTGTSMIDAASLQRQGYRAQFEQDLARATALRRLVDLDDLSAVIVDISPQTEYERYIRSFGSNGKQQAATQCPDAEELADKEVLTDRVKRVAKAAQSPDDLGLYPERYADRSAFRIGGGGGGEVDDEQQQQNNAATDTTTNNNNNNTNADGSEARRRAQPSVDAGLLGNFLSRVFPVMNAVLDDNAAGTTTDGGRLKSSTNFSSTYTALAFAPTRNRPVMKVRFSTANSQYVAVLYGEAQEAGPSPMLDQYASIVLLWSILDAKTPERLFVSHSTLTCICTSPSRPHLLYAGAADGSVCVWDLREPDRQHLTAGRLDQLVCRLPSYASSWQAENHIAPVRQVAVAGYNAVVGMRKEELEQLVSLDDTGHTKFWAVNDRDQSMGVISSSDYGLHLYSSVRLYLSSSSRNTRKESDAATTNAAASAAASAAGVGGVAARTPTTAVGGPCAADGSPLHHLHVVGMDFAPLDSAHFAVTMSDGIHHVNRFGGVSAPSIYAPTSHFFDYTPAAVPSCVQYSTVDSRLLVAGYDDGTVRLYNHTSAQPILTVSLGIAPVVELRCSGSNKWLTWALDQTGTLHLMDHAHKDRDTPLMSQPLHNAEVGACTCMDAPAEEKSEARLLALGYEKGVVHVHALDNTKIQTPASDRDESWL